MSRPTLVLLHGVGLDHTVWDGVVGLLADRFEVITFDLPGHGDRPPVATGATLADLAVGAAEAIPPGSHLVGFSLGALVAQYLAVHRRELVASLTSVASVCQRTPQERAQVLARLDIAANDIRASSAASLKRWYEETSVSPDQIARTEATLLANDPDSFLNCYRVFATADAEIAADLEHITVPALAVAGSEDPGSTPEMAQRLAAAIPDCRVHIIPGARHMIPVQCPRELTDTITAFLDTVIGGDINA